MSRATTIANSISIPPRPEILVEISREMERPAANVDKIAASLKRDVTLYGTVLRIVNSAAFNTGGNVTSVERAILLLGLHRIVRIVQVSTLQTQLGKAMPINRFWDTATEVAYVMSSLAQQFTGLSKEDAYTVGMFHDFGIPLMMQAFPDYKGLLMEVNRNPLLRLAAESTERYGFNHYDVGYELGKLWSVPDSLNQAIYLQPQLEDVFAEKVAIDNLEEIKTLLALLDVAKNISGNHRKFWRSAHELTQNDVSPASLDHLGLSEPDFVDLQDDYFERLEQRL